MSQSNGIVEVMSLLQILLSQDVSKPGTVITAQSADDKVHYISFKIKLAKFILSGSLQYSDSMHSKTGVIMKYCDLWRLDQLVTEH